MEFNISFHNDSTESNFISDIASMQKTTDQPISSNSLDYSDSVAHLFGPKRDSLYIVLPITIIYILIFIIGVVGNISTCIVISKNRSMHTATNYYLFSLAISDFLLLLSGVPQEIYSIWSKYPYVFGEVFCVLRGVFAETSANATVLTITAFTVERYVAICHPFLSHTMSKLSRAVRLIILIWILSITLAIPQALQFGVINFGFIDQCVVKRIIIEHSFEISTILFFFTPMTIITILYILIGLKLRSSNLMHRDNCGTLTRRNQLSACRQQTNLGTRRVLKMLVAVVVAFFICWAPFHGQRLVAIYGTGGKPEHLAIYNIMTYVSGVLYYVSTCINPLLYNIMSNKFREAFKETLARCCQISKRRYDKERAYRVLSRSQRGRYRQQESVEYSGSSLRDDSMQSTSTQKQSFDSMTLSRTQSVKRYGTGSTYGTRNVVNFDPGYNKTTGDRFNRTIINEHHHQHHQQQQQQQQQHQQQQQRYVAFDVRDRSPVGDNDVINDLNNIEIISKTNENLNIKYSCESINFVYNKPGSNSNSSTSRDGCNTAPGTSSNVQNETNEIKISFKQNRKDIIKIKNNKIKRKNKSKILTWLSGKFNWRKHGAARSNAKHFIVGYYSPTLDQISSDNMHIDLNVISKCKRSDSHTEDDDDDDGIISNSSLRDVDKTALEDELAAYMEELRLREKR